MAQHDIPLTHSHIKHLSISGFAHVETGKKIYLYLCVRVCSQYKSKSLPRIVVNQNYGIRVVVVFFLFMYFRLLILLSSTVVGDSLLLLQNDGCK